MEYDATRLKPGSGLGVSMEFSENMWHHFGGLKNSGLSYLGIYIGNWCPAIYGSHSVSEAIGVLVDAFQEFIIVLVGP